MKRQIKFRGKRTDNGEWVYGYYIRYINTEKDIIIIDKLKCAPACITVIPETVGQFTELFDKEGAEIYEGDIVKDDSGIIGVVEMSIWELRNRWGLCCWCAGEIAIATFENFRADNTKVIGNIHDNPQLCGAISN